MSGEHWSKFFWKDWESDPALKLCSLSAQGLWLRMLCIAAASTIKGEVRIGRRPCSTEDIAKLVGIDPAQASELIAELENQGVFDRASDGAIVNRRMVRDAKKYDQSRSIGKLGGRPKLRKSNTKSNNPKLSKNKTPRAPTRAVSVSASSSSEIEGKGVQGKGGFPVWWAEYPHKVGKRDAEAAYARALNRATAEQLLSGIRRYIASKPTDRPWCNPANWLNQDRWLDEPAALPNGHDPPQSYGPKGPPPKPEELWPELLETKH